MSPQCSPNEAAEPKIVDETKVTVHPKRTSRQATVRQRALPRHLTAPLPAQTSHPSTSD